MPTDSQIGQRLEQVQRDRKRAKSEAVRLREADAKLDAQEESIRAEIYEALEGELLWILNETASYRF
jgi:hypothetical protein